MCQHRDAFQELLFWSVVTLLLHTCVTGALWHEIVILKYKFIASIHMWNAVGLFRETTAV